MADDARKILPFTNPQYDLQWIGRILRGCGLHFTGSQKRLLRTFPTVISKAAWDKRIRSRATRYRFGGTATPGAANHVIGLLSKMFNLAEKWGKRPDGSNPCRHIEKYPGKKMERFLKAEEFKRLAQVLNEAEREGEIHINSIRAIRLLIFTGCRMGEILELKWITSISTTSAPFCRTARQAEKPSICPVRRSN